MKSNTKRQGLFFIVASLFLLTSCLSYLNDIPGVSGSTYCTGEWSTCKTFYESKLAVKKNDKWGYINSSGATVIPFDYDDAAAFANGIAVVKINTLSNIINSKGQKILPTGYTQIIHDVDAGVLKYKSEGKWGLLSERGTKITEAIYDTMGNAFADGLLSVSSSAGCGYIDKNGVVKVPLTYQEAYSFTRGLGLVKTGGLYGFITPTNTFALASTYIDGYSFDAYDRAIVQISEMAYGLIEKAGTVLCTGDDITGSGPLYKVEVDYGTYHIYKADGTRFNDDVYTYVNFYGDYLANVEWAEGVNTFDKVVLFGQDGTILRAVNYTDADWIIGTDGKEYVIDETDGLEIQGSDSIIDLPGGRVLMITASHIVYHNGTKAGVITKTAAQTIVIPFEYDQMVLLSDNYAIVGQYSTYGVVNIHGTVVVPLTYSDFNFLVT